MNAILDYLHLLTATIGATPDGIAHVAASSPPPGGMRGASVQLQSIDDLLALDSTASPRTSLDGRTEWTEGKIAINGVTIWLRAGYRAVADGKKP
jgi:hypothetical protein